MLKRIFIALLLDILAFTMVLPLLPRLMDHYRERYVRGEVCRVVLMS